MDKLFAFANDPRKALAALTLLGLLLFLPGFFSIPPIDRDEARFAQASKQMIETGNHLDIRYQKETRYKKPVGIYWLQTASTHLFGAAPYDQIWTYRVPSLIGAIAALWLTYLIGRTLVSAPVGFGAALLMASSIILSVEARLAKTDAMLLAMTLLVLWPLAKTYQSQIKLSWRDMVLFWLAMAAGILIKGPIILMVIAPLILIIGVLQKSPRLLLNLRPLAGIIMMVACVGPWLIAITIKSNGLFWQESVGHDMLGKVASGQESHGLPPGTHLAFLFLLFFPAIVPVLYGLWHGWKTRSDKITQFLLAWIIPTWLIFELTPTKLPHYLLPVYPAIALLAAIAISKVKWSDRMVRLSFAIPVALIVALNIKLLGIIGPNLPDFWLSRQVAAAAQGHPLVTLGYAEPSMVFLGGTRTELSSSGEAATGYLSGDKTAIAAVSADKQKEFLTAAKAHHIRVKETAVINGFNLGRGKPQTLVLYSRP